MKPEQLQEIEHRWGTRSLGIEPPWMVCVSYSKEQGCTVFHILSHCNTCVVFDNALCIEGMEEEKSIGVAVGNYFDNPEAAETPENKVFLAEHVMKLGKLGRKQ